MKKLTAIIFTVIIFSLTSCDSDSVESDNEKFANRDRIEYVCLDNGNIVAPNGTEYVFFAHEGNITAFGSTTFQGKIKGEPAELKHWVPEMKAGIYSLEGDLGLNILKRILPDSEWAAFYRKASLPKLDLSLQNCIRFELIHQRTPDSLDLKHMSCNKGISDPEEITDFLTDMKRQKSRDEAGLFDFVQTEDGTLENCCDYGVVYGFLKDEYNIAIPFNVTSYKNKAFSIFFAIEKFSDQGDFFDKNEIVLPEKWLNALQ